MKFWLSFLLGLALVLPVGCIGPDRPPVSEVEAPTWGVGQEWNYKGSDGQWRNWSVMALEGRRGFETYRVQVNFSHPDRIGLEGKIYWFDQETLGIVERQNGFDSSQPHSSKGWSEPPSPPRFPLSPNPVEASQKVTVVSDGEERTVERRSIQTAESWVDFTVNGTDRSAVEIEVRYPESNGTYLYWHSPEIEN